MRGTLLLELISLRFVLYMKKIPSQTSVALDVPARWNSTYFMLEVALKFQRVFMGLAK